MHPRIVDKSSCRTVGGIKLDLLAHEELSLNSAKSELLRFVFATREGIIYLVDNIVLFHRLSVLGT